jgi:hypothetical protein
MTSTLGRIGDSVRPVSARYFCGDATHDPDARPARDLQCGGTRTVGDLAARLGVDERTVRRYVVHLAELGILVRSVRGATAVTG